MAGQLSELQTVAFPQFPELSDQEEAATAIYDSILSEEYCRLEVLEYSNMPFEIVPDCSQLVIYVDTNCRDYNIIRQVHFSRGILFLPDVHSDILYEICEFYYRKIYVVRKETNYAFSIGDIDKAEIKSPIYFSSKERANNVSFRYVFRFDAKRLQIDSEEVDLITNSEAPISDALAESFARKLLNEKLTNEVRYLKKKRTLRKLAMKKEYDFICNEVVELIRRTQNLRLFCQKFAYPQYKDIICPLAACLSMTKAFSDQEMQPCPLFVKPLLLGLISCISLEKSISTEEMASNYTACYTEICSHFSVPRIKLSIKCIEQLVYPLVDELIYENIAVPHYSAELHQFCFEQYSISFEWVKILGDEFSITLEGLKEIQSILWENAVKIQDKEFAFLYTPVFQNLQINTDGFAIRNDKWMTMENEFQSLLADYYAK